MLDMKIHVLDAARLTFIFFKQNPYLYGWMVKAARIRDP
jgi:hypothetical protein